MKEKMKNVLNVILDIIMVLVMVFAVLVLVVALTQKSGNVSHLFGYTIRSVQTESMEKYNEDGSPAEGAFFVGDLIVCKISDRESYEVGETVMFSMNVVNEGSGWREAEASEISSQKILVTHQIIEVVEENGSTYYRTQGINNPIADINLKEASDIIAVYTGTRIGGVGKAIDFVQTSTGFLLCIILPIFIFVVIQAIRVVRNLIAYKAQKVTAAVVSGELTEEQKRAIAEEYLRSQQTSENHATPPVADAGDGE